MPRLGDGSEGGRRNQAEESKMSARKNAGRKSRLDIRRLRLKVAPAVVMRGKERGPRRIEVTGGGDKDWTISQV